MYNYLSQSNKKDVTMNTTLDVALDKRQDHIKSAKAILQRTQALFEAFGSEELKSSHAKFEELSKALVSDSKVLLVVIGEFTRGKSKLVNALLGIHLLPSAQEATTAINSFVQALPEGRTEKFIRIHFQDDRPPQDIPWTDDDVLMKWGTELNAENADARKLVKSIDIFTSHPLLDKGLVIIDTPGLQSIVEHHEEITRKAIAEAHIALWVQSTSHLGGNATEWSFMANTIRKNFRKFITVINMWDSVLEPTDKHDQDKPEPIRVAEKLEIVRRNFRSRLAGQPEIEIQQLTSSDNLMGVSALWALSDDPKKQQRSGVDKLANRISEMFSTGEALEQIYLKPLQQLSHIQEQLAEGINEELTQLNSSQTLEERQRDLEKLDVEIKSLSLELKSETDDAKAEHKRVADVLAQQIEVKLVNPLIDLKSDIEAEVTQSYVKRMIEKKVKKIGLPEHLDAKFNAVSQTIASYWTQEKANLDKTLSELRVDYTERMQKHTGQIKANLGQVDVSLPSLDISFDIDFSAIEEFHAKALELQQAVKAREDEIDSLESEKSSHMSDKAKIEMAHQALLRAEKQIQLLGGQPAPNIQSRRVKVKDGGMYSDDKYEREEYADYTNVEVWKEQLSEAKALIADREKRIEQIMAEEEKKTHRRMSLEAAQRKYEQEKAKLAKDQEKYERQMAKEQQDLIENTTRKLINSTAGQLEQRIRYLQDYAKTSIAKIFADQVTLLEACVKEQYLEPLNAKSQQRGEVQLLLQKGQEQVQKRQQELQQAQQDIQQLLVMTQNALATN